jgi:hypothetical protein
MSDYKERKNLEVAPVTSPAAYAMNHGKDHRRKDKNPGKPTPTDSPKARGK